MVTVVTHPRGPDSDWHEPGQGWRLGGELPRPAAAGMRGAYAQPPPPPRQRRQLGHGLTVVVTVSCVHLERLVWTLVPLRLGREIHGFAMNLKKAEEARTYALLRHGVTVHAVNTRPARGRVVSVPEVLPASESSMRRASPSLGPEPPLDSDAVGEVVAQMGGRLAVSGDCLEEPTVTVSPARGRVGLSLESGPAARLEPRVARLDGGRGSPWQRDGLVYQSQKGRQRR